jgi:O-antigen ligase
LVVAALWARSLRVVLAAAGAIAVMAIGLLFSFSQSSFVALAVGVLVAAAFTWRGRALLLVGAAAAVFVIAALASPNVLHHSGGLNRVTSGRSKLVTNGIKLAVHHPVIGVGVGGFKHAYAKQQHLRSKEPKVAASHDTPITVAAETGIPGLALLAWLFVAGLLLAFRRVGPALAGRAALFFGLVLTAIGIHSLFYNAFFEDPMVWAALGLAALTSRQHKRPQPPQLDREIEPERQQDQRIDGHKSQRTGERHAERLPEHG